MLFITIKKFNKLYHLYMFKNKKILCIIPARKNSQGLKNKNIKQLNNKPLIYWPIKAAKKSKLIDYTLVTTDSKLIRKISLNYNINCPFLRPANLSKNNSKISEAIIHSIKFLIKKKHFFDYIVLLEPTSPLTKSSDVDKMIKKIISKKNYTSLVTITKNITAHPNFNLKLNKKNNIIKKFMNKQISLNRQDISELYYLSGNAYISKVSSYLKFKSFIQNKTYGYEVSKWIASEIDDLVDFIKTEALMKYKKYRLI